MSGGASYKKEYADEAYSEETKGKMTVRFRKPAMKNGIIEFIRPEKCTMVRTVRPMAVKPFGKEENNITFVDEMEEGY